MRIEIVVTTAELDAECERRIFGRYPLIKQINASRGAGDVDFDWIDGVRAARKRLLSIRPIPHDFADDRHWPPR